MKQHNYCNCTAEQKGQEFLMKNYPIPKGLTREERESALVSLVDTDNIGFIKVEY